MNLIKEFKKKIIKKHKFFLNNKNIDDLIVDLKGKGIINKNILDSIRKVPRELFIESDFVQLSYENIPLPIACKQTISQPYVVAYMIDCLKLKKTDKVLEIGTGTGYQTALLAHLCKHICTIEIFKKLLNQAKVNHDQLKLKNISYMHGNGANGWRKSLLFDAVIISASAEEIPIKLLKNLKNGGKLIFPKKYPLGAQKLMFLEKISIGKFNYQTLFDVRFVPLLKKII